MSKKGTVSPSETLTFAKIHEANGDIDLALDTTRWAAQQRKRPSVALKAAENLLTHYRDIYKHETPRNQKIEVEHKFPEKITVEVVKANESTNS